MEKYLVDSLHNGRHAVLVLKNKIAVNAGNQCDAESKSSELNVQVESTFYRAH